MAITSTSVHDDNQLAVGGRERSILVADEDYGARVFLAVIWRC
jgi:hypothetical protein